MNCAAAGAWEGAGGGCLKSDANRSDQSPGGRLSSSQRQYASVSRPAPLVEINLVENCGAAHIEAQFTALESYLSRRPPRVSPA